MNTQVKVGIAAAIVAALVALIVLDQKTTPKDDAAKTLEANPGLKPTALRAGKTSKLPRIEKKEEAPLAATPAPAPQAPEVAVAPTLTPTPKPADTGLKSVNGQKVYTVQAGDT